MKTKIHSLALMVVFGIYACHPKDDTSYPKITPSEIDSNYLQPAYLTLHAITGSNQPSNPIDVFQAQSFCTDECIYPYRGGEFYGSDYERFYRLFEHTWDATFSESMTLWTIGFNSVDIANREINSIKKFYPLSGYSSTEEYNKAISAPVAQLRLIRSLGYFYLIDFFGNVPIITDYDTTTALASHYINNADFNSGRKILFDTIVNNINTSIPYLSADFNASTFGTFHKWAAFALLAKMYINAEEWTGTQKYDECIAACDSIINSGIFSLSEDYLSNFKQVNENSKENIFVIPYDENSTELYEGFYLMSLHYNSYLKYQTVNEPWNGFCALPDHYHSFDSNDVRKNGWSVGPQFAADNTTPLLLLKAPYTGKPLNFTPDFIDVNWSTAGISGPYLGDTLTYRFCLENNGARLVKYEIAKGLPHICQGVPLPLIRYADILMIKAEALMRKNGGAATSEAIDLVNQIRNRAGVTPYNNMNLTMDELLAERGREFYYEGMRRQDLIRFGKFIGGNWGRNFSGPYQSQWYNRSDDGDFRKVFPIVIQESPPFFYQNPGY